MGLQQVWLSYHQLFSLFFFLFLCQLTCLHAQLCTQEQTSVLLQFRRNFSFNKFASRECDDEFGITSFPKMESWKMASDCCLWDGVHCDNKTGQIIGLDLSCSWLQGAIHPNSSLFHSFPHLRMLNLAHNDFSMSRIPLEFTQFTELKHLDLSWSAFSGNVPSELSFLKELVSLDLSENYLRLEEDRFELLIQNVSKLRYLDLIGINMSSSVVPKSLLNLTSLRFLYLGESGLHGEFPSGIFHLPHLQELGIQVEMGLTGYIPDFINLTYPLRQLFLWNTSISGILPNSIAKLKSLEFLILCHCKFHGSIPIPLWTLPRIKRIMLVSNSFSGTLPSSISNLTQITYLDLSFNNFSGILPPLISNHSNLAILVLSNNHFTGSFFSWVANLPKLAVLDLSKNCLTGPLPSQVIIPPNLSYFSIGQNLINGTIPSWVFKLPTLKYLDLNHNKLTGHILEFQSSLLEIIDLSDNNLHGTVPNSTFLLRYLTLLILSSNSFSGTIPEPKRFSENLIMVELQRNNFSGTIHDSFSMKNCLKTINLNGNGFEGPIPKSLVKCTNLEVLDLGRNNFSDKFPRWLGHLRNLRVLILQSNKLHGSILASTRTEFPFPMLQVLDMSNNYFTGPLPTKYFKSFKAMMNVDEVRFHLEYLKSEDDHYGNAYYDSLTMVIKGSILEMEQILTIFAAIDLSSNKFEGEIPEIIGGLNSVQGLNLSHNSLTGPIPKLLGNMTMLEWLDLSSNRLTGEIPRQLVNLNFLAVLNLSHNRLMGPIPQGKQFDTFLNDSYINNSALCGPPLSNTCGNPKATQPPTLTFEEEDYVSGFGWEVILPGYGFGLVVGFVMGYLMFSFGKPQWLVKMVERVGNRHEKRLKGNARSWRHGGRRN